MTKDLAYAPIMLGALGTYNVKSIAGKINIIDPAPPLD